MWPTDPKLSGDGGAADGVCCNAMLAGEIIHDHAKLFWRSFTVSEATRVRARKDSDSARLVVASGVGELVLMGSPEWALRTLKLSTDLGGW
jgi:hypothetical protein